MSLNCSVPTNDFSLHKNDIDVGIGVGLGLGLSLIACTLFIYFRFIKLDKDGQHPVRDVQVQLVTWLPIPPSEISRCGSLWYQKKAIVNIIAILSAFAFAPSVPWSSGEGDGSFKLHLDSIFNAFLVQWGEDLFKLTFWILVGVSLLLVYVLLPCTGFFMVMCRSWVGSFTDAERDQPTLVRSSSLAYKLVAISTMVLDLFGLSILTLLFTPLNCTYYEDAPPTLDIYPSVQCWRGEHLVYAACSVMVLIPLYTWSMIVQICDHEVGMAHCFSCCCDVSAVASSSQVDDIQCHYKWAFFYTQLKLIIAAGNAFFSHHSLSILLSCDVLIFALSCLVTVNQYKMHNILRRLSVIVATVVCGFIAQIICNPAQLDSFIIWICGLFVLVIISVIVLKRAHSKEYYAKLWRESSIINSGE